MQSEQPRIYRLRASIHGAADSMAKNERVDHDEGEA